MGKLVCGPRKCEEGTNNKRGRFSSPACERTILDVQDQWSVFSI